MNWWLGWTMVCRIFENSSTLKNYAKSTLPVVYKQSLNDTICWQHGLLNILSPLLRPTAQKKRIAFKVWLLFNNKPGHSRGLLKIFNEINVVFMPANKTSILQPMDQWVILSFKSYYLINTFFIYAAITSDHSGRFGQSKLNKFWESSFQLP